MAERVVTRENFEDFFEEFGEALDEHKTLNASFQQVGTGKWGMARLWRSWMAATAKFMALNGVTMPLMINADGVAYATRPFNGDDAHELFTRQHLGVDENGLRLSWAKSIKKDKSKERVATKGERFNALRKHEMWSSERGIILFKPRKSEYQELTDRQSE